MQPKPLKSSRFSIGRGNIRELRNVVERLIILSGKIVSEKDVEMYVNPSQTTNHQFKAVFDRFTNVDDVKKYIEKEYSDYKAFV